MASLLTAGFQELGRKGRRLRLRSALWRGERALSHAEAELGLLGWEQVDFFDLAINEEVERLRGYERSQAHLINTSAEISSQLAVVEDELAKSRAQHLEGLKGLEEEREPLAERLAELEGTNREKREALERFKRAVAELEQRRRQLEARQQKLVTAGAGTVEEQVEAVNVARELVRLPRELELVRADQARVLGEANAAEIEADETRHQLRGMDEAIKSERERFAEIERKLSAQIRQLTGEQKKSDATMSQLDGEKSKPYRAIGACLADHEIAPLNQPQVLHQVLDLRSALAASSGEMERLKAETAAADPAALHRFYALAAAIFVVALILFACLLWA